MPSGVYGKGRAGDPAGRAVQETFSRQLTEGLTEEELETCFRCFAVFGENMDRLSGSRKATKGDAK